MDALLAVFISWQFLFFCLGIAALTFVFRKLLEFAILDNPSMPGTCNSRIWRELILPITPVLFGGLAAYLAKQYPYPAGLVNSSYGRISFGLVAGLLSGLVYRVVVALLRAKITLSSYPGYPTYPTYTNTGYPNTNPSNYNDPNNLESPFIQSVRNSIIVNNQSGVVPAVPPGFPPTNNNPPPSQ
jgi:hypothetical protein